MKGTKLDMKINSNSSNKQKRIPVWGLVVTDIILAAISIGVFMLFDYILPNSSDNTGVVVSNIDKNQSNTFSLPEGDEENDVITEDENSGNESEVSSSKERGVGGSGRSNTNTSEISSDLDSAETLASTDKTITNLQNYNNDNINLTLDKVEVGSGSSKVTYYVADVYTTSVEYLKTAFANGTYGKNIRESVVDMATDNNSVLAISGDYYGNTETGIVIRNGVLYRDAVSDTDICVLYTDGTMKTYSPSEFDADQVIDDGAWQAWSFGPSLLDGNGGVLSSFNTTSYINGDNPRCAIGYVEEGHYIFVVVDGRDEGYSAGVTLSELAGIMSDLGCVTAYNLDGGKSSAMVFGDDYVSQPADGGRTISDIIYIGE
jgi:exopolysaccharide biosynthesis protein